MSTIPGYVRHVMKRLRAAGYEAWCVGGCVRDTILGRDPADWDIATSAAPEEVRDLFPRRTIPTGLRHGTVTVRSGREGVEVTTFRCDGTYEDHRHPSSVTFTSSLEEDLRRRDFTINAMAMGLDGKIRDPFGGQADLRDRILRCVGDPEDRFQEDALRIMRGLRFAAVLGFPIEAGAAEAMHRNAPLLREIARERIQKEMLRLICGVSAAEILRRFPDVIGIFWPEVEELRAFDLRCADPALEDPGSLWEQVLCAIDHAPPDLAVRLALLFRGIGRMRSIEAAVNLIGSGDADAGRDETDAGSGDADAGSGDADAGSGDADAGSGDADAGSGDADAGSGDADTGSGDADTGNGDVDTGRDDADTGSGDIDAEIVSALERRSREAAEEMLQQLRSPKVLRRDTALLLEWQERGTLRTEKSVRRALRCLGAENFRRVIALRRADRLAKTACCQTAEVIRDQTEEGDGIQTAEKDGIRTAETGREQRAEVDRELRTLNRAEALAERLIREGFCFTVRDLRINGEDLKGLGLSGKKLGEALEKLLRLTADGKVPNERSALLQAVKRFAPDPKPAATRRKKRRKKRPT